MEAFERAIKAWTEISLATLQKDLDEEGLKIVENQASSAEGRKELAARTKQFRKMGDEDKLVEIKGLLKLYQQEIDSLTNRGKYAESSFMKVYKLLAEAPDPKPLLEASVDSVSSAAELSKITQENAKLNDTLSRYSDYESIKAKLMKLEMSSIETAHAKVAAKEAEMVALMDEKERSWKLREEELVKQLKELRASQDAAEAQLSRGNANTNTKGDVEQSTRFAELELVAGDLERANRQVLQAEKRNLELRKELEHFKSGAEETSVKEELESKIVDLEGELSTSAAKLENSRTKLTQTKAEASKKLESLEREVQRKTQEIDSLRGKLSKQNDYDELKRELEMIRSIQFSNGDEEDAEEDEDVIEDKDDDGDSSAKVSSKLDKMMYAKNKKLSSDLTIMRVKNGELSMELEKAKHEIKQLESEMENIRELNNKLEEDIGGMRHGRGLGAASMVSGWTPGSVQSGRVSPTSSIIGGRDPRGGNLTPNPSDNSILPIITQQRDRFRARNNELEQELRKNWSLIATLRKDLEAVKKDNLDLYERSRYVTSYKKNNPFGAKTNVEDRYKSLYEESISPFAIFKGRESQRALSQLNYLDRMVYSFTKVILANKFSRNLFVAYCFALHLLVFVTLTYGMGLSASAPTFVEVSSQGVRKPVGDMIAPQPI